MKTKLLIAVIFLAVAGQLLAYLVVSFPGWGFLEEKSKDVIVARCGKSLPPPYEGPLFYSEIEITFVLKGSANTNLAKLLTDHELRQGENYLIFGSLENGICHAYEEYRIVPLGANFSTNSIAGKPLDDQIQIMFRHAIDNLNSEVQKDQKEKQRLEEGLQK